MIGLQRAAIMRAEVPWLFLTTNISASIDQHRDGPGVVSGSNHEGGYAVVVLEVNVSARINQ